MGRNKKIDKGAFAKTEITIKPCENGSYMVRAGGSGDYDRLYLTMAGFTDYRDLLRFLNEEYEIANRSPASAPSTT